MITAKKICESFEMPFKAGNSGQLIFGYNTGQCEHFGVGFHLVPTMAGFWISKWVDLNLIKEIFVCNSVMEVVAFLHFNAHRYNRHDELLFLAIAPMYNYPVGLFCQKHNLRLNLLFGTELIDVLRAIKFCLDFKGIGVCFYHDGEMVTAIVAGRIFSIHQKGISLRKFFTLLGIRPFFRQHVPKSKISFLHDFLNQ